MINYINFLLAALSFYFIGISFKALNNKKPINIYFMIILLIVAVPRLLISINSLREPTHFYAPLLGSIGNLFLLIPLYIFYFKYLLEIPLYDKWSIGLLIGSFVAFLTNVVFDPNHTLNALFFIAFSSLGFYRIYKSIKVRFKKKVFNQSHEIAYKNWIKLFFTATLLLLFLGLFASYSFIQENTVYLQTLYRITSSIWLFLFAYLLFNPIVLYGEQTLNLALIQNKLQNKEIWSVKPFSTIKEADLPLSIIVNNHISEYIFAILNLDFIKEKAWIGLPLTKTLAKRIRVPHSHIKYLFKYHCLYTAKEFENYLKIKYAIVLLEKHYLEKKTIKSLMEQVGYDSKSTFYDNFKKYTGKTVTEYK